MRVPMFVRRLLNSVVAPQMWIPRGPEAATRNHLKQCTSSSGVYVSGATRIRRARGWSSDSDIPEEVPAALRAFELSMSFEVDLSLAIALVHVVVIDVPVLASNATDFSKAAMAAIEFVAGYVISHSDTLQVQTSRGNYLWLPSVQVDFDVSRFAGAKHG
ncbi:hypothetical protein DFH94DRAFT_34941 [Russula ochroleuca]|uniref:Uncharacterized protein n=1 Tax=Russula ochroleuca TaxID=152965 RepID=A0A9P5T7K4_9AGAM|nr:hypothetical protein DFH94DRAFT_34941 [Russula ochroleuca]